MANMALVERLVQLKDGETVEEVLRRAPLVEWPRFLAITALFIAPFAALFPLMRLGTVGAGLLALTFVLCWLLAGNLFVTWCYTMLVVTTRRMIDIEQRGFFDRRVADVSLERVTDILFRRTGVAETLFNVGTVIVITDGTGGNIEARGIARPKEVQHALQETVQERKLAAPSDAKSKLRASLEAMDPEQAEQALQRLKAEKRAGSMKQFFQKDEEEE